jgi:hypothetical protein
LAEVGRRLTEERAWLDTLRATMNPEEGA